LSMVNAHFLSAIVVEEKVRFLRYPSAPIRPEESPTFKVEY
jgi:hypothetical protein